MMTTNTELEGVARSVDTTDVDNPDGDMSASEFAALCNAALARLYPSVRFVDGDELNVLTVGNGVPDVSDRIDYEAVVTATVDDLAGIVRA